MGSQRSGCSSARDAPALRMLQRSEPPLRTEGLQAGRVTAFNRTRIDTSFQTILFCLFFGNFLHIPGGKRNVLGSTGVCLLFSIGTLKHGECASQCFVCLKFFSRCLFTVTVPLCERQEKRRLFENWGCVIPSRERQISDIYIFIHIYICFCVYTDTFLSSLKY